MFTIQPARPEDREARLAVIRAAWEHNYRHIYTPQEMADSFSGKARVDVPWIGERTEWLPGYQAETEGTVIGVIVPAMTRSGEGEVVVLYVHPDYQGLGVGRALWDRVAEDMRARGVPAMHLHVLARAEAVNFYERIGCYRVGEDTYSLDDHAETVYKYRFVFMDEADA